MLSKQHTAVVSCRLAPAKARRELLMFSVCLDSQQLCLQHWCNSVVVACGMHHTDAPKTIAQLVAALLASPWTRSCMLLCGRCIHAIAACIQTRSALPVQHLPCKTHSCELLSMPAVVRCCSFTWCECNINDPHEVQEVRATAQGSVTQK
jgi:hypothetical protein